MLTRRISKPLALAMCVLTLTGLVAVASPLAPFAGTDTRVSTVAGDQREYAIDINPNDSRYAVASIIHGAVPNSVIEVARTGDGGLTWTTNDAPFPLTKDPSTAYSADGSVYVQGVSTAAPPTSYIMRSTDNGATWSTPVSVALGDRPTVVVDNAPSSPNFGTVYLVALDNSGGSPSQRIKVASSTDQGATWSAGQFVSTAPPAGGYDQAPMPRVASDGTLYVAYQEYSSTAACGATNIIYNRIARSTDGGATFSQSTIGSGPIIQGGACISAQAGRGIFCITAGGSSFRSRSHAIIGVKPTDPNTLYAVYSGGDLESAYSCSTGTGFHSDTLFTRSTDGGLTWTPVTKINGDGQGFDQFMPWMDTAPDGTIWAGWQDRREDPNNFMMRWYQAYSTDEGNTWTEGPVADVMSLPGTSVGDYHGLAADNGQVLGMWIDYRTNAGGEAYTESHVVLGTAVYEGHPGTTSPRNQQPVNVSVKLGAAATINYPVQTTDGDGNFTVPAGVPVGVYNWRVKSPKFLANGGTVALGGTSTTTLNTGVLRAGDANNDNVVTTVDFNILKGTFGNNSDPRGDFNDDGVANIQDFSLLRGNFGQSGAPPLTTVGR